MGTTPFFATPTSFPDRRFENLDDKDLLSIHADDFWGVPWGQCNAPGRTPPAAWAAKWTNFANAAASQGKTLGTFDQVRGSRPARDGRAIFKHAGV